MTKRFLPATTAKMNKYVTMFAFQLSVCLSACLSVFSICVSICLLYLCVYLSFYQSVYYCLSFYQVHKIDKKISSSDKCKNCHCKNGQVSALFAFMIVSLSLSVSLSFCLFFSFSLCLSVYLSICPCPCPCPFFNPFFVLSQVLCSIQDCGPSLESFSNCKLIESTSDDCCPRYDCGTSIQVKKLI
jgi:hypothetical protein